MRNEIQSLNTTNRLDILYSLEITFGARASFKKGYPDYPVNSVLTLAVLISVFLSLLHLPHVARHNLKPFCLFARRKIAHVKQKQA